MGKKCKRKVQWRRLSLNELQSKTSDEDCDDEEDKQSSSTPPLSLPPDSRPHNSVPRRPFHSNFHPGDQRRFSPHFDQRGSPFERGPSVERSPYPKYFGRPYPHDNRPPFPGQRRRPYKFFGRGGFYVRGPSPYSGDRGPRRRWSEDDGLALEDMKGGGDGDDILDDEERASQPVHTVFIGNEEYTKIQTPRQEVIFKKSSLDKKRDSVDLGSSTSTCGSVNGCEPSSQCDQASLTGSIEDTVTSNGDDPSPDNMNESGPYEDSSNMYVEEPGNPPLLGVVMQQAYPGGPMISIPVHWTPYLDPGLIPGDTALTPLDPAFTHVFDPKDLPVDPAHMIPVQHDSNGCPVTVQVKVNADGQPVEIEPSAFTVSLSTLEPHQQEVLLRKSSDLLSGTSIQPPEMVSRLHDESRQTQKENIESKVCNEAAKELNEEKEDSGREGQEHGEDFSSDSQYATMSEASTTPTTPSGELSDPSEAAETSNKKRHEKINEKKKQMLRSDSLLDSESYEPDETEEPSSFHPLEALEMKVENCAYNDAKSLSAGKNGTSSSMVSNPSDTVTNFNLPQTSNLSIISTCNDDKIEIPLQSNSDLLDDTLNPHGKNGTKKNKKKKSRSISIDSTVSSQNSLADSYQNNRDADGEPLSKYQVKKIARKLKKEKRSSREKSKAKCCSPSKELERAEVESEITNPEIVSGKSNGEESVVILDNVNVRLESPSTHDHVEDRVDCEIENQVSNETEIENGIHGEDTPLQNGVKDDRITMENSNKVDDISLVNGVKDDTILENGINNTTSEKDTINVNTTLENETLNNVKDIRSEEKAIGDDISKSTDKIEENSEEKKSKDSSSTPKEDENFTCKPGYVMVPILTPYYDPAVLYGYPVIIPETPPERNYGRKKKKKFKKRFHEEIYLDTELYAGEPFVATPNGYVVPLDANQICQIHGYQYLPNVFPHILPPDEGFVSVEHSPFLPEYFQEPAFHKLNMELEIEKANRRVPKLYEEEERKPVEEGMPQNENKLLKDQTESCDSGVSESEELVHLTLTKGAKSSVGLGKGDKEDEPKRDEIPSSKGKESDTMEEEENSKIKNAKKEGKKKKRNSKKPKKDIVEILEPDFASFDSPTPRFEVGKDEEQKKLKGNKKSKNRKRKNNQLTNKNNEVIESISSQDSDDVTKFEEIKEEVVEKVSLEKDKSSSQLEPKVKKGSKNKSKQAKLKSKLQTPEGWTNSSKDDERKTEADFSSAATECLVENNFIEEVFEREDASSIEDTTFNEALPSHSINVEEVLSQESGIGVESEESLIYSETYESCTLHEDQLEVNLDESHDLQQLDSNVMQAESDEKENVDSQINIELIDENIIMRCSTPDNEIEACEPSEYKSLIELEETKVISSQGSSLSESDELTQLQTSPESSIQHESNSSDLVHCEAISLDLEDETISSDLAQCEVNSSVLVQCEMVSSNTVQHEPDTSVAVFDNLSVASNDDTLGNESLNLRKEEGATLKDLGVTEAVRRWIREVTPEKAFSVRDGTRHIIFPTSVEEICEESDNEESDEMMRFNDESKNVLSNPPAASPSNVLLVASSGRVASRASSFTRASHDSVTYQRLRRHTTSQDKFDDADRERVLTSLGQNGIYSSSSSFPLSEDLILSEDPRVYDPSVYSKYYQLSADVQVASSTSSTRESTLSPSFVGSEEDDIVLFPENGPTTPLDCNALSIATELLKSEKIREHMARISPSFRENTLQPMPLCGSSTPYCEHQSDNEFDERGTDPLDPCFSMSSSGIGSSLASTPNLTPAHQFVSSTADGNSKPKLEPYPLKNLSAVEGPLPCRTMCCSVM